MLTLNHSLLIHACTPYITLRWTSTEYGLFSTVTFSVVTDQTENTAFHCCVEVLPWKYNHQTISFFLTLLLAIRIT
jgi:hypothetical protein